jgi:hypothetical protein
MFREFLKAKNWDAATEVYDLAMRLGKGSTGRPDKVWQYWLEKDPKEYLRNLSQMISSLEAKLSTSPTSEN